MGYGTHSVATIATHIALKTGQQRHYNKNSKHFAFSTRKKRNKIYYFLESLAGILLTCEP